MLKNPSGDLRSHTAWNPEFLCIQPCRQYLNAPVFRVRVSASLSGSATLLAFTDENKLQLYAGLVLIKIKYAHKVCHFYGVE